MFGWLSHGQKQTTDAGSFEYDVYVFVDRYIKLEEIERLLKEQQLLQNPPVKVAPLHITLLPANSNNASSSHHSEGNNAALEIRTSTTDGKQIWAIRISAPVEFEPEHLDFDIAAVMDKPLWHFEIYTMPGCAVGAHHLVEALYKQIANLGNGFVYNYLAESVIYKSKTLLPGKLANRTTDLQSDSAKEQSVELIWQICKTQNSAQFMPQVLKLWSELEPLTTPRKSSRPGQNKVFFDDPIETLCQFIAQNKSQSVSWVGQVKGFKAQLAPAPLVDAASCHLLKLSYNYAALQRDPSLAQTTVKLFYQTAQLTGAFYGGVMVVGSQLNLSDRDNDTGGDDYHLGTVHWQGLPDKKMSLTWFGKEYFSYIKDALSTVPEAKIMGDQSILLELCSTSLTFKKSESEYLIPDDLIRQRSVEATQSPQNIQAQYRPAPINPID